MRKWTVWLIIALLLSVASASQVGAEEEVEAKVELSVEQKNELANLYKEIFDKKKVVIAKYVEYGVFSKEKGEKIIAKFEKHHEKLAENGYIPRHSKSKKHK
ncbi:YckD family protein [bacterium LRH843]|nr:YckD family protein [bacterium LRH843]